jgi:hypothetical protein
VAQRIASNRQEFGDHLINVAPAVPALVAALIAISLHYTADFGLAYRAGAEAWANGHPQDLVTFTGTPLLALVMALVSLEAPEFVAARIFMAFDISLWMVLLVVVWSRLRPQVQPKFWWATLLAAGLFAPAVSVIFWLQFDLVILVLALGGFVLIDRRPGWATLLIGFAVAFKPIVILLPLALLLQRRSRWVGAWAIAVTAVLTAAGLVFLAWRAHDLHALDPFDYLSGFLTKGQGAIAACVLYNYSPVATLCRLGVQPTTALTAFIGVAVLILGWLMIRNLPDMTEGRWETFAGACFLSIMVGPIDWAHYGILMGPLYLLLAYQLWRDGAPRVLWLGLGVSFALVELVWDPLTSLAGASVPVEVALYTFGQFSQYFLLFVWVRWRLWRRGSANNRIAVTSPSVQRP